MISDTPKPTEAQLAIKVGDPILVLQDTGELVHSVCRTAPWRLGGHTWVLQHVGRPDAYALARCYPLPESLRWLESDLRSLHWAIGTVERALERRDRMALSNAPEELQPLVDAAMQWVLDGADLGLPADVAAGVHAATEEYLDTVRQLHGDQGLDRLHAALRPWLRAG